MMEIKVVEVKEVEASEIQERGKTSYTFTYVDNSWNATGGLDQKEVYASIKDGTVSHLVLNQYQKQKNGRPQTFREIIDMIAYPADYRLLFKDKLDHPLPCTNYGLALDKFGRFVGDKLDYISKAGESNLQFEKDSYPFNGKYSTEKILELAKEKKKALFNHFKEKNPDGLIQLPLKQNWRMVLNLGATSAYNNGFLLHKLYGLPYLPGQAIKGVLRHYVICTYFESDEKTAWRNQSFRLLFGNNEVDGRGEENSAEANSGKAVFFDVFPSNANFKIEADIMNPHISGYYEPSNLNNFPNDTTPPRPIKFLTLKNALFTITVFVPKEYSEKPIYFGNEDNWNSPKEALEELLEAALKFQGIGAKTNLGYGRLVTQEYIRLQQEAEVRRNERDELNKELLEQERQKQQIEELRNSKLYPLIEKQTVYGDVMVIAGKYKTSLGLKNQMLPEADHDAFLKKLAEIYTLTEGSKKNKFHEASRLKSIAAEVGEQKMEEWFKINVK